MYVDRPDVLWQSSGCYVYECRVPLLEGERRATCTLGENPNEVDPDENVCHASLGGVCHVLSGGRVPTATTCIYVYMYRMWVRD